VAAWRGGGGGGRRIQGVALTDLRVPLGTVEMAKEARGAKVPRRYRRQPYCGVPQRPDIPQSFHKRVWYMERRQLPRCNVINDGNSKYNIATTRECYPEASFARMLASSQYQAWVPSVIPLGKLHRFNSSFNRITPAG
jgi:hypothetical protein